MDEVKCPVCGRKPKPASVWKVCPRFDGDIVCINCCRSCKYYFFNKGYISHGCKFNAEPEKDEWTEKRKQLARIEAEIRDKETQEQYFYKTSRPRIAQEIGLKIVKLQREAALIRKEIKEL